MKQDEAIAIITARGGSKRIPRKNIRNFLGFPVIKYPIDAAMKSGCFDEVMVSTDDEEIADIARRCGASVPFLRSMAASDDFATTADVVGEVIEKYEKRGRRFRHLCCIYPTAVFIGRETLRKGLAILKDNRADAVVPVVRFGYPIHRALKIEGGKLVMLNPEHQKTRSQDLPDAYHDAGQFYWILAQSFRKQKKLFMRRTLPIELSEDEVQDIDTVRDWNLAERKYRQLTRRRKAGQEDIK